MNSSIRRDPWLLGTFLLILLVLIGTAAQWHSYPRFLDSYYHLAVMQGFDQAGGVALHAFWEAAPEGRPHLYPPLFHLLWMPMLWITGNPIVVSKIWTVACVVVLVAAMAATGRALGGSKKRFFFAAATLACPQLYLSALIHPTATFACAGILAAWVCLEKRRTTAAGICLGLTAYLHPAIAGIAVAAALIRKEFTVGAIAAIMATPWWVHVALNRASMHWVRQPEASSLELPILMVILGWIGIAWTIRKEKTFHFPLALIVVSLPIAFLYPFRIVSAQGLLPLAIFTAALFEKFHERVKIVSITALVGMTVISPIATIQTKPQMQWSMMQSPGGLALAWVGVDQSRGHYESLYDASSFTPLVNALKKGARSDDLLFCNYPYMAGLFSTLTGLSTTTTMVLEVERPDTLKALENARRILWFKVPLHLDSGSDMAAQKLAQTHGWKLLLETPLAFVYEAPAVAARRQIRGRVIPWGIAYGLLFMVLGLLAWSLRAQGQQKHRALGI